MEQPIKYIIPKLDKFKTPTPLEMKKFSENYSKDQWRKLTFDKSFLNNFTQNLDLAKIEADRVLGINKV